MKVAGRILTEGFKRGCEDQGDEEVEGWGEGSQKS